MGLLHKYLILASVASVAMVGFLNSSSASALDGVSFFDNDSNTPKLSDLLGFDLRNPFGGTTACEGDNPSSTISCNVNALPTINYNLNDENDSIYGHDGKGLVFINAAEDDLINGNPQVKKAKRGDTLDLSLEILTKRYHDDDNKNPITLYSIGFAPSVGLTLVEPSTELYIGGQQVPADSYQLVHEEIPEEEQSIYGFNETYFVELGWSTIDQDKTATFNYPENATIELRYSLRIEDNASSTVYSRPGVLMRYYDDQRQLNRTDYSHNDDVLLEDYQATAVLDGDIRISRSDENGNPISGVSYTVSGVKAQQVSSSSGRYSFDANGNLDTFVTDENGLIIIKNVPLGDYTATEISSPNGSFPVDTSITKSTWQESVLTDSEDIRYKLGIEGLSVDITDLLVELSNGEKAFSLSVFDATSYLSYDEEKDRYGNETEHVIKTDEGYRLFVQSGVADFEYSPSLKKHIASLNLADVYGDEVISQYSITFGDNQATVMGQTMDYDEADGCYRQTVDEKEIILCKDSDGYQLEVLASGRTAYGARFRYNDVMEKYVIDLDFYYIIEDINDEGLTLWLYSPLYYSESFDKYYIGGFSGAFEMPVSYEYAKSYVTEFSFIGENMGFPEEITNPQTSDTILKVLTISAIALLPTFVIRKHLSRR